jgi:hypothetical protein
MSSAVDKNKNLDFTKDEKISKNNIDYFNLKEDRAKEEKREKFQNFRICLGSSTVSCSFCSYYLFLNNL